MNAVSSRCLMVLTLVLTLLCGSAAAEAQTIPAIAPDAQSVVDRMGTTLSTGAFSFRVRTIRPHVSAEGLPLHVFHTFDVLVRRPDRLAMNVAGDDGSVKIASDGKNLIVYSDTANKYLSRAASGTLEDVLREAAKRLEVEFPLADLLADNPAEAFLRDVAL